MLIDEAKNGYRRQVEKNILSPEPFTWIFILFTCCKEKNYIVKQLGDEDKDGQRKNTVLMNDYLLRTGGREADCTSYFTYQGGAQGVGAPDKRGCLFYLLFIVYCNNINIINNIYNINIILVTPCINKEYSRTSANRHRPVSGHQIAVPAISLLKLYISNVP